MSAPTAAQSRDHTPRAVRRARGELILDACLIVAFTLVYSIGFTGQSIHEWLGIAIGGVLFAHLALHWEWVARVTRNLVSRRGRAKIPWLINLLLLTAMTLCVMSGIYISVIALPAVGVPSLGDPRAFGFWRRLHSLTANATLILVPIHVGMDWRWILGVVRNLTRRSPEKAAL